MSASLPKRTVAVRAPAKINLQLSVGLPGDDGYHPLATVFQAVSLWETVVASARADDAFTVEVDPVPGIRVDLDGVPLDETNLAVRAARAVAGYFGVGRGIDLRIVKGVPVAGGMAGGSADAAAALVASAEAWDVGATRSELAELAAVLGADVPFAFHGHTAIGIGRGDLLTPAMTTGEFHWVVATQATGLSTASVFAEFDRSIDAGDRLVRAPELNPDVMAALRAGDPQGVAENLANDLQQAAIALAPYLTRVLDSMNAAGALGSVVSGSGPTVVGLARSRQHALAVAANLTAARVADAVHVVTGPSSGASIVASGSD